jgi:hypothetical protein
MIAKIYWWARPIVLGRLPKRAEYLPLVVPIILFVVSLSIPPTVKIDSAMGFLALRSMLEGGAFNSITVADPANIANDIVIFLTWWSPGQYLVPGLFIWLGTSYGVAVSLTALIATLIGVAGWIRVARSFAVSSFVLFVFVLGLNTFPYVTDRFLAYWGGELLLFAAAPWSLYAMRWAANKPPILCFTVSVLSAAVLFFAKLSGLIVFATNVGAISLLALASQRRLSSSTIAMWVASAIAALCFMMFWAARGAVPAGGSTFSFSWLPIWFSVTAAAFSGMYGLDLFLGHPWMQIDFQWATELLALLGLVVMVWMWFRLGCTRYRDMAGLVLTIIVLHAIVVTAAMYVSERTYVDFQDRYYRYAGILFFLLLLTAMDQWRMRFAKGLASVMVIVLGLYGLRNYASFAYAQMRAGYYDPMTGLSLEIVSPAVLEYLRSEVTRHNFQRPAALMPSPGAFISLSRFGILYPFRAWLGNIDGNKWSGSADKIFVVLPEERLKDAEPILRDFTDYKFENWKHTKLDGMIIYTQ